ncbi:MAG: KamA family radical SAM protein [candidate division Zixibacteria bacterium]|nr:KamA family radical SAM protein [candidate division Zixibacteria bacterium]
MTRVSYIRNLDSIRQLPESEKRELLPVVERYQFRTNSYYLSLINWSDPNDPIRRIAIPQTGELREFGRLDVSNEHTNYVAPGCQHKYPHTALLLCTEMCASFCRFCFRKRLFMEDNDETAINLTPAIDYIRHTPQINNVLLSGGDPLTLSTRRLTHIIEQLRAIPHVKIIRIGSKIPAVNPHRIINDPDLLDLFRRYSSPTGRIYLMTHFNVPQELTDVSLHALDLLMKAGVVLANQTPILRGINHRPTVLAKLMQQLAVAGVPPYYFFQGRPTEGNLPFALTLVESYHALERAKAMVCGLAKRASLIMSHDLGKIAMVGLDRDHIYLRYHRAREPKNEGLLMVFRRDDSAYWLDDLQQVSSKYRSDGLCTLGDQMIDRFD